ncbi:MAG: AraC family transcriptional regulator [Prevotella sp.]|nr:AraC family transcriptional regulator [Prevotella sp.]
MVRHYRESRNVKFYANLLHLSPKHFTFLIRQETGGLSPFSWIEQYVVTQAKYLIESHPSRTLGAIAYDLGFSEPTAFFRYFKRVTGMTAKQYRESLT